MIRSSILLRSSRINLLLWSLRSKFWTFVHDCLIHPIAGIFWIICFPKVGDWLHDITVDKSNYTSEAWTAPKQYVKT